MKVLVIQQKMIGDVLVSSMLFELIKQKYPNAKTHFLIHNNTNAVVLNNPFIDEVILNDSKKKSIEMIKLVQKIRKQRYDVIIDLYAKIETHLITLFSGSKTRISYKKKYSNFIYNHTLDIATTSNSNVGFTIVDRQNLLSPLKIIPNLYTTPKIYVSLAEKTPIKNTFLNHKVSPTKKTFMISIIGSSESKTYPKEYMADVINMVTSKEDCNILFNYIPNQKKLAQDIYNLCNNKENIYFDLTGKSLRDFITIMDQCDAIIGNDGGATNIAKALNKPSYIIFSPWITKEGWNTYEDGKYQKTVHLKDFKPAVFKNKTKSEIKSKNQEFYKLFQPSLFKEDLMDFIETVSIEDLSKYKTQQSVKCNL